MNKAHIINNSISSAWKRTMVFLRLVRHKTMNRHLPGSYHDYSSALIEYFREVEKKLNREKNIDRRWWDRRSKEYTEYPLWNYSEPLYDRHRYDDAMRQIIKTVKNQISSKE